MSTPRIKICCISSAEEAKMAIQYGASALGLVGQMPSGPGIISDDQINKITRTVPPPIATFLLTSQTKASQIIQHYQKVNTSTIQIVDALEERDYASIKTALPHVKLVQVIHVIDNHSIQEAEEIAEFVDAILLDSGNPNLATKELGGTGRTHNWNLSKQICERIPIPVFLAGGINASNIQQAVEEVNPFGIDLCSSVRTNGQLDEKKLSNLFDALAKSTR